MNGVTRKKIYAELSQKHGALCQFCGRRPEDMQLVIDHIDNNNSNNDRQNLRLLCRRCNYIKNPRRPVDECVSDNVNEKMSELHVSTVIKPKFKELVYHELNENSVVTQNELLNTSSELLNISQVTAKRYLDGMCSKAGLLSRKSFGNRILIQYKTELEFV